MVHANCLPCHNHRIMQHHLREFSSLFHITYAFSDRNDFYSHETLEYHLCTSIHLPPKLKNASPEAQLLILHAFLRKCKAWPYIPFLLHPSESQRVCLGPKSIAGTAAIMSPPIHSLSDSLPPEELANFNAQVHCVHS